MENRTTTDNMTHLKENEVFVFGSNLAGRHGAGAARTAMTYAIPTKDREVRNALPLIHISAYVSEFINLASVSPQYRFLVTEIGCGLSGYSPADIAPMFFEATWLSNVCLPERFWNVLNEMAIERSK